MALRCTREDSRRIPCRLHDEPWSQCRGQTARDRHSQSTHPTLMRTGRADHAARAAVRRLARALRISSRSHQSSPGPASDRASGCDQCCRPERLYVSSRSFHYHRHLRATASNTREPRERGPPRRYSCHGGRRQFS